MSFMPETRWLDEPQQRSWRAYIHMQGRLAAALNRQLQADSELSLVDFEVLVHLTDVPEGRVRVFELGRSLQWEKSRLSHHLSRMARRGLIAREECGEDGRGAFAVVTEAGRRAIEAAAPSHVAAVRRLLFEGLTPEQVETFGAVCEHVLAQLVAHDPCATATCSEDALPVVGSPCPDLLEPL
jgi:DNA-binding MarR family transcriptional regulator